MGNKKLIVIGAVIFILSIVGSFIIFSNLGGNIIPTAVPAVEEGPDGAMFDPKLPKTQVCPMNGAKYSKQQEKWWQGHRPLGVMIENHEEARPQSGLSSADVVYEAVAEGGITRFLAVFYCQDAPFVGPVRSARTYFLDFISEYGGNPLYAHVGGANTPGPADALGQIVDYGWNQYNDLNQFSIPFPTFWQDKERLGHPVATEHTMYSSTSKLWDYAKKNRKLTNVNEDGVQWGEDFVEYTFKDDPASDKRPSSQVIDFDFWNGFNDYSVQWSYDPKTNSYLRENGGDSHNDNNTDKQIAAKNVVILFMKESRANDGYEGNLHMLYGTKGKGDAIIFQDGKEIEGTWSKKDRTSRLIVKDSKGTDIQYTRGLIWFDIVSPDTDIKVGTKSSSN